MRNFDPHFLLFTRFINAPIRKKKLCGLALIAVEGSIQKDIICTAKKEEEEHCPSATKARAPRLEKVYFLEIEKVGKFSKSRLLLQVWDEANILKGSVLLLLAN